jgi:hypothetical protein
MARFLDGVDVDDYRQSMQSIGSLPEQGLLWHLTQQHVTVVL